MGTAARKEHDDGEVNTGYDKRFLRPLSEQEKVFVGEYLVCFSASKAARRAGYTKAVADAKAGSWLRISGPKPHVAQAVQSCLEKRHNDLHVTRSSVINELRKIGFSNMLDYIEFEADDHPVFKLSDLSRDKAAAIKKVTIKEYQEGKGSNAREIKEITLELHDKKGALVELGKHVGLFAGGATGTGKGDDDERSIARDADGNPVQQISHNTTINNFEISLIPSGQHFYGEDGTLIDGEVIQAELDKIDALDGFKHIDAPEFDE